MLIVMVRQSRIFKAKVAPKIINAGGSCAAKKIYYNDVKLLILVNFTKVSLPIPECIGVAHAGMNNGKVYKTISYYD